MALSPDNDPTVHDLRADRRTRRAKAQEDDADDTADVHIDPLLIQKEYIMLPGQLAHRNAAFAVAYEDYLESDLEYDRITARLRIFYREVIEAEGGKSTEGAIKDRVETDQRWINAKLNRIDAEVTMVQAKGKVEALRAKKDMLVSVGAHIRAELGGDPSLRDRHKDE